MIIVLSSSSLENYYCLNIQSLFRCLKIYQSWFNSQKQPFWHFSLFRNDYQTQTWSTSPLTLSRFLTTAITTSPPAPTFRPPPSTCPGTPLSCQPSPFTTIFVTSGKALITKTITTVETQNFASTVTLPTVVSLPHSCFTYLIPTPQSNNAFCGPFTLNCGPSKQCTVTSTTTGAAPVSSKKFCWVIYIIPKQMSLAKNVVKS